MGIQWNTKQAMRHLVGKCSLTLACSLLSPVGAYITPELYTPIATKYDGYSEAEPIYHFVITKYDGYVEADATMFIGTKYDGYLDAEKVYCFSGLKYDGYYGSSVVLG